jgi:hypothetical protein
MKRRLGGCVVCCALAFLCAWPIHAKRLALVIGNDNYQLVPKLEKAGNDAEAVARELQAAGFAVSKFRDLDYKTTVRAFEGFYDRITGGDEVVVFYAGHGVQTRTGNYLLPTDIDGETESQIEKTSYPVNSLLEELDKAKPGFSLIVIDACRDNPLRSRGRTIGAARGLTPPEIARGQVVIFSASRGQQALDSLSARDSNANSVFTRELVARMRQPGLGIDALGLELRVAVEQLAATVGHIQRPYISNEATGNFYFIAATQAAAPAGPAMASGDDAVREDKFWEDAKAAGNREGFDAYLELYATGRYASLARANIRRLTGGPAAPSTPAPVAASVSMPTIPPPLARDVSSMAPRAAAEPPAAAPAPSLPPATASAASAPQVTTLAATAPRITSPPPPAPPVTAPATSAPQAVEPAPTTLKRVRQSIPNGDSYEGEVRGETRTGQGVYVFANGDRYEGGFVDNRFEGKGVQTYKSGDRYDGDFLLGVKHGRGVYRFANGDQYEGDFAANVFDGKGVLKLVNGDRYEGEFRDNAKNGRGVHYFASGERYEGAFVAGAQSGTGTHFYKNGDQYTGQFANGVRHGKGVYRFADGDTREFEFQQGVEKPN